LFGTVVDLCDEFPQLNYVVGYRVTRDVLENVVGRLGGLLCLGWGLTLWIPTATKVRESNLLAEELAETNARLRNLNETLEVRSRKQEQFVSLVENASEFITMTTLDGETIFMNRAGQDLIGLSSDHDLCHVHRSDYLFDDGRRHLSTVIPKTASKDHHWVGEMRLRHLETGDRIDVIMNIFTVLHPITKAPMCFGMVASDISQLKEVERELVVAKKIAEDSTNAKSEFLANMSHEIRTPMTAILGFAETLREPDIPSAERDKAARTISENGKYLLEVINDILDLSKIEAGKLEIEQVPFSPFELIDGVDRLMRPRAKGKGLDLQFVYTTKSPARILSDPTRVRQILINLIGNSLKFTERGAILVTITFLEETAELGPRLDFCVLDSGCGMTDSQVSNLFKPFAQADSSTTRKFGGTGLGLTISKRLTKLLGGEMAVHGAPNDGSLFRFSVPTGALDGVAIIDVPTRRIHGQSSIVPIRPDELLGVRVLLAEDNEVNRDLISRILSKAGAQVSVAPNGEVAIRRTREALEAKVPFDVVLMDMQMPVIDGYEATRRLRKAGYDLPIVALTANAMKSDRDRCVAAGCDDYATKPIDRRKLFRTIRQSIALQSTTSSSTA
jgi:PAS domain S-box-containing protein